MLFSFLIFWLRWLHPFYVSITEIRQNPASHSLEISCRMFSDDLEKALEKQYHTELDIIKPKDKTLANKLIQEYVKKHLLISMNGKALNLSYVGYEIQEDGAWSYFEAKGVDQPKKINIHNDLLYELHPEQINMMHVTVGSQRKSTKVGNPDADIVMNF